MVRYASIHQKHGHGKTNSKELSFTADPRNHSDARIPDWLLDASSLLDELYQAGLCHGAATTVPVMIMMEAVLESSPLHAIERAAEGAAPALRGSSTLAHRGGGGFRQIEI